MPEVPKAPRWVPVMLADAQTRRTCGLAVVPMEDGKPVVELEGFYAHTQGKHHAGPSMVFMLRSLADLEKLDHYIIWSPLFRQWEEKLLTTDLIILPEVTVQ